MPPITRNQLKKNNSKTEPYSKENRPLDRRTALIDIDANNASKSINSVNLTKIKRKKGKNDNIPIDSTNSNCVDKPEVEFSNPIINKSETCSSAKKIVARLSLNKSEDSLYYSVSEDIKETRISDKFEELYTTASTSINDSKVVELPTQQEPSANCNKEDIFKIDGLDWNNCMYIGCYARDIFIYLHQREEKFKVIDYMNNQSELNPRHRSIVINWLVVLQEMFGLNHEVLYMAVELIDLYLMKHSVSKSKFQLLASAAILLSNKIDVRDPDLPYDLVKHCKFIFTESELFEVEKLLAKSLNFDINIPLSYAFLRRYARCLQCQMILLTLARYILESSLLEYRFVTIRGSLKAASSLYLAFKMCNTTLDIKEFHKYTGYNVKEIKETVIKFNDMLHNPITDLSAVRQKYTHETFYKVANKSLISNSKLT